MKYEVKFTNQFKKDLKLAKKQNKDLDKLFEVVGCIRAAREPVYNGRTHTGCGTIWTLMGYPGRCRKAD